MSWTRLRRRAGIGATVSMLAASAATAQGVPASRGLIVEQVSAESPVGKAGVLDGDVLLTYDGKSLRTPATLQALQENTFGKREVELRLRRGQDSRALMVAGGSLGIESRPEMGPVVLPLYEEGRAALAARNTDGAIAAWTSAATAAQGTREIAAAWLHWRIGMLHEGQRRWKEAYASLSAALELHDDTASQSQILAGLGRVARGLNDLPAAAQRFARAREMDAAAGHEIWEARNLTSLGNVSYTRGDLTAAEEYEARALAIKVRLVPDSADVAASLNGLGAITYARGDLAAAHDYFNRALTLRERLVPGSLDVAASLGNLGVIAKARGDHTAAREFHNRALEIRQRLAPDSPLVAGSLTNLGIVAESRGDLVEAEKYDSRALDIHERHSPGSLDVASDLNNLGNVAASRGDFEAARTLYQRALALKVKQAPGTLTVASTLKNLGDIARSTSDLTAAADYHRQVLAIEQRIAPGSLALATTLNNLGRMALQQGDHVSAQESYSRALAITERQAPNSLPAATSLHDLGVVSRRLSDLARAQGYYIRALAIRAQLAPDSLPVAETLTALGDVAMANGRFAEADEQFARAVGIVEAQRSTIASTDARALLLAQHAGSYGGRLRALVALNDLPAAFATLEGARARSLVDFLAERRLDFRAEAPLDLLEQQQRLDEQRSSTYVTLISDLSTLADMRITIGRLDLAGEAGRIRSLEQSVRSLEARLDGLRQNLQSYAVQQRSLDARIRQASPRLAALRYPEPLDLAGAQAALDAGTLLLAYFVDEEQTHLFVVNKASVRVFPLPLGRDALAQRVTRFRELVTRQRLGDPSDLGAQLYEALIRPAGDALTRADRVLIAPDGPLQTLPFAALVSRRAPAQRYFVEDKPFHMISSMTVYAETRRWAAERRRETQTPAAGRMVLAFGDPVYVKGQSGAASGGAAALSRRGLNLAPLPRTREEVEQITKLFGTSARVRLGREATETAAKRDAAGADILHFAVHGWMDAAMGLNSGLALSQPEALGVTPTTEDDGLLQAWEIFERVRVRADLVVLSACETGLGQDLRGEGLIGLTRAFLYAGARSVVVSLWDVSDAGAAELMRTFYQALQKGDSKDVALRHAMLSTLRNPARRHPFYWTPFNLVGDWR